MLHKKRDKKIYDFSGGTSEKCLVRKNIIPQLYFSPLVFFEIDKKTFLPRETSWPTMGDKCAGWETSFLALYFDSKVGDKLAGLRDKLVFGRQVGQPETSWPGVPETSWPSLGDKFFNYDATHVTF